jgi:hypothetical protein
MSIFHRTAYLTLSTLLAIVPAACGGDDDDDDDTPGNPDASGGDDDPDAAPDDPDAAPIEPDATVIEGDQFLLSIELTALGMTGIVRNIATVAIDGTSADLSLQPLFAPECNEKMSGQPVGDPLIATGIEIDPKNGSFTINLVDAAIPPGSVGIALACNLDITADTLDVTGNVLPDGTFCGEIAGQSGEIAITGTFGTVPVKPDTPPEELPDPVVACEK